MSDRDKVEVLFKILIIIQLLSIMIISAKLNVVFKRINQLEKDYKIYEINLKNLEKNKDVHFAE